MTQTDEDQVSLCGSFQREGRHDVVSAATAMSRNVDALDAARADEYALLAHLLRAAPSDGLLSRIRTLVGDSSPLGQAHADLARAGRLVSKRHVDEEHFQLFIGLGRGEVLPYASFYLTGFLHGRPLARVRTALSTLGLRRDEGEIEPEDHLATLCEVMSGLVAGHFPSRDQGMGFFETHLAPWAAQCFGDMAASDAAVFYKAVGNLGRVFIEIEAQAFRLDDATDGSPASPTSGEHNA